MSSDPERELLRIAEAVTDAETVDWDEASGAHPAIAPILTGLQQLEALSSAFRSAASDDAESSTDGLRVWGRLEVLQLIGKGGFGEVYRARDPVLDREVALKLRTPTSDGGGAADRRALDEGRRLARVRHPNVLTVYGADEDRGRVGIWTELIDGPDMRSIVTDGGVLEPAEAVASATSLCRALSAVHGADLVHGDVKASNVFRDADGRIVLGDFGSASELDASGPISGSPVSMAPERLRGAAAEPTSDVYSLGVLLYFLLSGNYPVEGENVNAILERWESHGPVPVEERRPELPEALAKLVNRAVAADPARRFTTAAELEQALETAAEACDPTHPDSKPGRMSSHRRPLTGWLVGLAAAAVVVVAVLVARIAIVPSTGGTLVAEARLVLDAPGGPVFLESGASIAPGDRLYLEIEAEAPVHVYVANEDETGAIFTLFPVPGLDRQNPLPAGRHRLPGTIDGAANDWQVTSAGGAETFLVVAAPEPVEELEQRLATWAAVSADRPVSISSDTGTTLRGVGALAAAPPGANAGARLSELQRQLSEVESQGRSLWSRRFVLHSEDD